MAQCSTARLHRTQSSSLSLTLDGITATLTANVGVLNTTSSGFGVNHPTAGDPTDLIDAFFGTAESVTITFSQDVRLEQLVLSLFTPSGGGGQNREGARPKEMRLKSYRVDVIVRNVTMDKGRDLVPSRPRPQDAARGGVVFSPAAPHIGAPYR